MARFTGTRGRDEFIGISGQDNRFVFLPGNLAGTDIVSGSTALTDIDTLVLYRPDGATGSVRAQAGKFDQVRNIEVVELADPGIELTVSQQLAGSSQRGFLTISGSSGNDVVSGQPTDPSRGPVTTALVFNANGGADSFTGGEGDDIFRFGDQDQSGTAIDGAGGSNIVRFAGDGSFDFNTLSGVANIDLVEVTASDGGGTVILSADLFALGEILEIRSSGADTIDASASVDGVALNAILGTGDDILIGGDGDEFVEGGDGDDTFFSGFGLDNFDGGDGLDTLILDYSDLTAGIRAQSENSGFLFFGGYGLGESEGALVGLESVEQVSVTGTVFDDFIFGYADLSNFSRERFVGFGGAGDDNISVVDGEIHGEEGNDSLTGSGGAGLLFGGTGDDRIFVRGNSSVLAGYVADGGSGDDQLIAGGVNNVLNGGEGNDTFRNGLFTNSGFQAGTNTILNGEAGDDRFYLNTITTSVAFGSLNGGSGADDVVVIEGNLSSGGDLRPLVAAGKLVEVERFLLDEAPGGKITLDDTTVINLSSERPSRFIAAAIDDAIIIQGGSDDVLDLRTSSPGGSWAEVQSGVGLNGAAGGDFDFWAYTSGGTVTAFLAVDSDVTVTTGGNNAAADAFVAALQAQEAANYDAPLELTQDLLLPAFFDVDEPVAPYSPIHGDVAQPHIA